MRTPSSQKCRLDLAPPWADRFISGITPSITARHFSAGPSDSILRYSLDGHPALRSTASGGFRSVLAVSSFRFCARLDLSIPSAFSGQRGITPACWIWRPSSERQRDFNPPEQRAAQHAVCSIRLSLFRTAPIQIGSIVLVWERSCQPRPWHTLHSRHKTAGLVTP